MPGSLFIGRVMGIRVEINSSWFIIFALITYSLATSYFPETYPSWSAATRWMVGGAIAIMLFGSVLLHELTHSLVSTSVGIPVRKITLFIFGGIAQIEGEPDDPVSEFKISLAGPAMSVLLFVVFSLAARFLSGLGPAHAVVAALTYVAGVNLVLAIFNLIPAFPLDGGRVLRSVLWYFRKDYYSATRTASFMGNMFGILLMGIGAYWFLTGDILNGLWFALIGWYIHRISRSFA